VASQVHAAVGAAGAGPLEKAITSMMCAHAPPSALLSSPHFQAVFGSAATKVRYKDPTARNREAGGGV